MNIKSLHFAASAVAVSSLLVSACVTTERVNDDDLATTTTRSSTVATYEPGYVVESLPVGYQTRTVSGRQYYLADDVYYTRDTNGYTVVNGPGTDDYLATNAPPVRTGVVRNPSGPSYQTLETLPTGYQTRAYNGREYYILGTDTYVRGPQGYVITTSPF